MTQQDCLTCGGGDDRRPVTKALDVPVRGKQNGLNTCVVPCGVKAQRVDEILAGQIVRLAVRNSRRLGMENVHFPTGSWTLRTPSGQRRPCGGRKSPRRLVPESSDNYELFTTEPCLHGWKIKLPLSAIVTTQISLQLKPRRGYNSRFAPPHGKQLVVPQYNGGCVKLTIRDGGGGATDCCITTYWGFERGQVVSCHRLEI